MYSTLSPRDGTIGISWLIRISPNLFWICFQWVMSSPRNGCLRTLAKVWSERRLYQCRHTEEEQHRVLISKYWNIVNNTSSGNELMQDSCPPCSSHDWWGEVTFLEPLRALPERFVCPFLPGTIDCNLQHSVCVYNRGLIQVRFPDLNTCLKHQKNCFPRSARKRTLFVPFSRRAQRKSREKKEPMGFAVFKARDVVEDAWTKVLFLLNNSRQYQRFHHATK